MTAKLCPIMSSANYKVNCDSNCAFCFRKDGYITCSVNILMQDMEEINKKLDTIISNQGKTR